MKRRTRVALGVRSGVTRATTTPFRAAVLADEREIVARFHGHEQLVGLIAAFAALLASPKSSRPFGRALLGASLSRPGSTARPSAVGLAGPLHLAPLSRTVTSAPTTGAPVASCVAHTTPCAADSLNTTPRSVTFTMGALRTVAARRHLARIDIDIEDAAGLPGVAGKLPSASVPSVQWLRSPPT